MNRKSFAPGWLSIADAAYYTGYSVSGIDAAIKARKFPAYRPKITAEGGSRSVRVRREHLDAWIEGREIPADEWPE